MAELIDFSYARFTPVEVKALGRVGIVRYVASGRPEVSAVKAEVDAFRAAGLAFVAVWQRGKDRTLTGYAGGREDALDARDYCAGLGATGMDPIHFSVDMDATSTQLPTVGEYFVGVASVLGWQRVGVYGGIRTLEYLHGRFPELRYFWQTASWSGGQLAPFATLHQYKVDTPSNPVRLNGKAVDFDRSLASDFGQWGNRVSRYPSCTWKPITGTSTSPVTKDILCLHTMVGYMSSTWTYFNRSDVSVYSHILVGGPWGTDAGKNLDGVAWQIADTNYRAAANLNGNGRIISVETADNAPQNASDIVEWTPAQCNKIVQIMVDAHRIDGIPLVLILDSKPGRRGIAYHRLGCDPYRVDGGELWSAAYGKTCPTDRRIRQIPGLIARAVAIVNGTTPTPEEDVPNTEQEIKTWVNDCIENKFGLAPGEDMQLAVYGQTSNKAWMNRVTATNNPLSLASMLTGLVQSVASLTSLVSGMKTDLSDDEQKIIANANTRADEVKAALSQTETDLSTQIAATHPVDPNDPTGV